jgi:Tfp pilus assembly protein PilN
VQRLRGGVQDPYLAAAAVSLVLVSGAVAWLQTSQSREADVLEERQTAALADSSQYATVIAARRRAQAAHDSVQRQLGIIAAIDSNRYVWAHVLDEVSRSLPAYTWLTNVQQTSAPPSPPARAGAADTAKAKADTAVAAAPAAMRFRVVGQTVDIQALTAFMRDLEASPFVQGVQLQRSEAVLVDGKDVTEFTLDGEYESPGRALLRTRTITVPVR